MDDASDPLLPTGKMFDLPEAVAPLADGGTPAPNTQNQTTDAPQESALPFLAHNWAVLMLAYISEDQARMIVSGVSPDATPWNLEHVKTVGPGCTICGQEWGESEFCPGPTDISSFFKVFEENNPT